MRRRALLWLASALSAPARAAGPADRCGDLLGRLGLRPPDLRFVSCEYHADQQGRPLRATYRVPGTHAVAVERYLVRAVGLHALRRSCCQWDAPARSFRGRDGGEYDITMTSDESFVRERAGWAGIDGFEVVVELFTEPI